MASEWMKRLRIESPEEYRAKKREQKRRRKERLKLEDPERYKAQQAEAAKRLRDNRRARGLPANKKTEAYKLRRKEHAKEKTARVLEWFSTFKATQSCQACPETEACCLEFHHLDPTTKISEISDIIQGNVTMAKLKTELAKCACLCSNCHKKLHAGIINPILTLLAPIYYFFNRHFGANSSRE